MPQYRLRLLAYEAFAPVLPNFIRSTLIAAIGIIVEASPPYPAERKKRGFAPGLPNFVRRTSSVETGIITVG